MKVLGISLLVTAAFVLGAGSCSLIESREPPLGRETQRSLSPDGRLAAVILTDDFGGATGSNVDNIYVIRTSESSFRGRLQATFVNALNSQEDTSLTLSWQGNDRLVVAYRNRRVTFFDNRIAATERDPEVAECVLRRL